MARKSPRSLADVDSDVAAAKARLDALVREQKEARELHQRRIALFLGDEIVPRLESGDVPDVVVRWFDEIIGQNKRGQGAKAARDLVDRQICRLLKEPISAEPSMTVDGVDERTASAPRVDRSSCDGAGPIV